MKDKFKEYLDFRGLEFDSWTKNESILECYVKNKPDKNHFTAYSETTDGRFYVYLSKRSLDNKKKVGTFKF